MTKLYSFNTAEWTFDYSMLVRLQNPGEPYDAICPAWLIDHPEGLVVFDTGVSPDLKQDPAAYGPYGAPHMADFTPTLDITRDDKISTQIESVGYNADDVEYVLLSHLHVDHAGDITGFPNAEFIVQQPELEYCFWPTDPVQQGFYLLGDFGRLRTGEYDVTPIDGEYDLFGDGSLELIPTPGHTPGHQSLKVELDSGTVILGADIAHQMTGYENELVAPFNWNTDESIASIRKIKNIARKENAEVYITHDAERFTDLPEPPDALE